MQPGVSKDKTLAAYMVAEPLVLRGAVWIKRATLSSLRTILGVTPVIRMTEFQTPRDQSKDGLCHP
jgi:hypothetical protein